MTGIHGDKYVVQSWRYMGRGRAGKVCVKPPSGEGFGMEYYVTVFDMKWSEE